MSSADSNSFNFINKKNIIRDPKTDKEVIFR